jgi:L-amino acid N-acyltransferase YncA
MRDQQNYPQITRPKKILFVAIYLTILAVFIIITSEAILHWKGFRPWRPDEIVIKVNPGGKLYARHPTLGYANIPGEFTVTLSDGYSFKVTNLPDTLRITHPRSTYGEVGKKAEIWIFGCSLTYGWSLNDQETFPWLLQERFPQYEVVNFGVNGYGTVQSLIQLRQALAKGRVPKVCVLDFASWHDERSLFSRNWQRIFAPYNKLGQLEYPYARLDHNGKLNYYMGKVEYNEFPFMRHSALSYFIEQKYNKLEEHFCHIRQVTKALLLEFANTAKQHNVPTVVAGITYSKPTRDMLSFVQEHGFKAVDIAVDLDMRENTNYPHDGHPSASANKKYADKLEAFLRTKVLE